MIAQKYRDIFADESQVKILAKQILEEGALVLPAFFEPTTVEELTSYSFSLGEGTARQAIMRRAGTPAMNIAQSDDVMLVFDGLHKARCALTGVEYRLLDPTQQAVSLPIAKPGTFEAPVPFHFDDSFINAVFAMRMPSKAGEGNLLVYNNLRRLKPYLLSQIAGRLIRHFPLVRKIFPPKEIGYQQGALHLFFGDITLHGVNAFTSTERVTYTINASRIYKKQDNGVPNAA